MSHAVQVEIICDICEQRFVGLTENIPNTMGRTKGTPLTTVRVEAAEAGWRRIKLPRSGGIGRKVIRVGVVLDCCPNCRSSAESSLHYLTQKPLWFEKRRTSPDPKDKPSTD